MADPSGGGEMVTKEYSKGNWTVSETLVLIEAKKMDEESRLRLRSINLPPLQIKQPDIRNRRAPELRWKWIEEYCWRKGCVRSQNQCNDKWDNLMRDYKKIREYESWRVESSFNAGSSSSSAAAASSSYWNMDKSERKERSLPSNMLPQIYEALVELVQKKSLPSSSSSSAAVATVAVGNGNGGSSRGQMVRVCQQSLGVLAPMMAQPMHQIPATIVLPLPPPPPPPPPPQYLVLTHPPPPQLPPSTSHAETIQPTGKRRRSTTPGETTVGGQREAEEVEVGAALSKIATMIGQGIRESEERQERRHKEVVRLQERRLMIEESKAEINRQGLSGLGDAISKLGTSIIALVSSSCHNDQNHQGGAP